MLYQRIVALSACLLISLVISCGGGYSETLSPQPSSDQDFSTDELGSWQIQEATIRNPMKVEWNYGYSTSGFASDSGMALVPIEDDATPAYNRAGEFQLKLSDQAGSVQAELMVDGSGPVLAHFHYNEERWRVEGVCSTNVWETEDFVGGAFIIRPGMLLVYSMPVGNTERSRAEGIFARVDLSSPGKQPATIYTEPYGYAKQNVLWWYNPQDYTPSQFTCAYNFRMDGDPGDVSSKDEQLTGGELSKVIYDNYASEALLDGHGYQWYGGSWDVDLKLTWREYLRGDHNADGIVTVSDYTPVGQHWAASSADHWSNREVYDSTGNIVNLYNELSVKTWEPASGDFRKLNKSINAFWFVEADGNPFTVADGYTADPSHNCYADAADSNWDGFVRDWYNTVTDPGEDEMNAYYDGVYAVNHEMYYRPGDSPAVGLNYGHAISGYAVWCVKHTDVASFAPDWKHKGLVQVFYRDNVGGGFPANGKLNDSKMSFDVPVTAYPELDPGEIRPSFTIDFMSAEAFGCINSYGSYDLIIWPYYYNNTNKLFNFAAVPESGVPEEQWAPLYTRIQNAVKYGMEPVPPDDYGPVYRGHEEIDPVYPYASGTGGIISATQMGSQPDVSAGSTDDGFTYLFRVVNADDVEEDANNNAVFNDRPVVYEIYAYYKSDWQTLEPGDVTDPYLVFSMPNLIGTWQEAAPGQEGGKQEGINNEPDYVEFKLRIDPETTLLPAFVDDKKLWFGVHVREADYEMDGNSGNDLLEYTHPNGAYFMNYEICYEMVKDYFPPYFVSYDTYRRQGVPTLSQPGVDFFTGTEYSFADGVEIVFNPAADPGRYQTGDVGAAITYELYISDHEFLGAPTGNPQQSKTIIFDEVFEAESFELRDNQSKWPFTFEVFENAEGLPFARGESFWFLVIAKDFHNNLSRQCGSYMASTLPPFPEPVTLSNALTLEEALIRGDLEVHNGDLHLVYPTHLQMDSNGDFNYEMWPDGQRALAEIDENMIQAMPQLNPGYSFSFEVNFTSSAPKVSLSFCANPDDTEQGRGDVMEDQDGIAYPVVGFAARDMHDGGVLTPFMLMSGIRVGNDDWDYVWHLDDHILGDIVDGASAVEMLWYPYFEWPISGNVLRKGLNSISWVDQDDILGIFGTDGSDPIGSLYFKQRDCEVGYWSMSPSANLDNQELEPSDQTGFRVLMRKTDVITRHPGRCAIGNLTLGGNDPAGTPGPPPDEVGNTLYILSSTPHDNIGNETVHSPRRYEYHDIKLHYNRRPQNAGDWHEVDLKAVLGSFVDDQDNVYPYGPNSMEVIREPNTVENHHVYVTYCNAANGDNAVPDQRGLRVAYANCVAGSLSSWESPDAECLIDDDYYYPAIWYDIHSTTSLVDIKRKPSAFAVGAPKYQQLGCAYLSPGPARNPGTKLMYAELDATGWTQYEAHPGIVPFVDGGHLLWVKLEYLDDSTPVVMYAVRPRLSSDDYYVKAWIP